MKLKNLILITLFAVFISCESDNSLDVSITDADLIGTWNIKDQTMDGNLVYTANGQTLTATHSAFCKRYKYDPNF
ncbi:MAG: hypothetical protein WAO74_09125 [Polaribacter sp.]|uniref:hypothetical protein n=1 Tax=Polaribacter sp. TaxID=1920175 RepID=UPI003BAF84C6